jgi:hypothetical protein
VPRTLLFTREGVTQEAVILATDAGEKGMGAAYTMPGERDTPRFWAAAWPRDGAPASSTGKELMAVVRFVEEHREVLAGKALVVLTDSTCLCYSLLSGVSRALPAMMSRLFELADRTGVRVLSLWMPREQNKVADFLSSFAASLGLSSLSGRLADVEGDYLRFQATDDRVGARRGVARARGDSAGRSGGVPGSPSLVGTGHGGRGGGSAPEPAARGLLRAGTEGFSS